MTTLRFHLVRHAKAEPQYVADAARQLTPEGRDRFAAHAASLAVELSLTRIVASPFARAVQTAELLAQATGAALEVQGALASGASSGAQLLALARQLGHGVALVGHNPEIAQAVAIAAGDDLDVPPGTVAAIDADADGFTLAWLRTPA
jgi:phosphohistidine phosphatase